MYTAEAQDNILESTLDQRLGQDTSGALRDGMVDELRLAVDEIAVALEGSPSAAEAQVLKRLLESVKLSEAILLEVWASCH